MLVGGRLDLEFERGTQANRAGRLAMARAIEREDREKDVRLVLALGASEPCHCAEDDDEDDADEETPAVFAKVSRCSF